MKRLSLLVALSALLVSGLQTAANAQLAGSVILDDTGHRDYPIGINETGRFARFIGDNRLTDETFSNRDFENWKPLDVRSKEKMEHFMFGKLRTSSNPVWDEETGRFQRYVTDDRLYRNNMWFENRDFAAYKANTGTAKANMQHFLRGLSVGTNLDVPGRTARRVSSYEPLSWY